MKHHFTDCIVWIVLKTINSKKAVKIATTSKHSAANMSHYEVRFLDK